MIDSDPSENPNGMCEITGLGMAEKHVYPLRLSNKPSIIWIFCKDGEKACGIPRKNRSILLRISDVANRLEHKVIKHLAPNKLSFHGSKRDALL
jgi:hypothetical protein